MKTTSFLILLLFIFSCSKDDAQPEKKENLDPVGSWSLFKLKLKYNAFGPLVQDTTIVPCIKGSKMIIETNGTWRSKYVADSSCVIYFALSSSIAWQPNKPEVSGTWTKNENFFTIQRPDMPGESWDYPLSMSGGKMLFSYIDTAGIVVQESWYIKD